jgi:hypothetical protein
MRPAIFVVALAGAICAMTQADESQTADSLWRKLKPYAEPPAERAGQFGSYRSPLNFGDGSQVMTPSDWARRRQEIARIWHMRLGAWPELVERPVVTRLETVMPSRVGHTLGCGHGLSEERCMAGRAVKM